ncbi:hypothetical protein [Peptoniphilus stercorisuis]|uniref:Uncharacterized protein n=1 Tax=Peptoniphilus stercorisuis TaxID=1436965 RepID=A0ABS4KHL4_9FIRM|nr:hypothetical protein [Peptoniphilus stercorisuis]MBP2026104.1 hypothetical protein [Peptoniphilus stercorisuis]
MQLGLKEYSILENRVLNTIKMEMMDYNRIGELNLYLRHINMYDRVFENRKLDVRKPKSGKIAVIGQSNVKLNHLLGIGKDLEFHKDQFEFCLEYENIEKYDFNKLKNGKYSFILVGPMSHKIKNGNGYSSMIERLKSEDGFPEVIELRNENELKISKSNFRQALENILDRYEEYYLN